MAKFASYKEMGKKIAEEALDGYIYKGKTIREWIDILAQTRWIPVYERLPEAGKQYLCCNEDGFREVGYLSKVTGEWGFTDTEAFGEVIAWMPLPEPYKGEGSKE